METAFVCNLAKSKINGHSLGTALMEAMSRKTEGERNVGAFDRATGCPGIIDTGASKTVIGQSKIKSLIRSLPVEVQRKMNWKKSETAFRFGNNAILPSVGAVFLPFGSRWMKVEVVAGETPFLLSNSFLKSIDADVCTGSSTLRLNQLGYEVPLQTNSKGLFVVELAEVIAAFSREHQCQKVELVTAVTVEQQRQQQIHHQSAAEVELDQPLPFPEDPSMTYMTVTVEEEIKRPPGVQNLRQWGQMVMAEGKYKGSTFMDVINKDREYSNWMKKHQRLSSDCDWAVSFQNFVKAWDQTHGYNQVVKSLGATPKAQAMSQVKKIPEVKSWSEDEEELVMIESGGQVIQGPKKVIGSSSSSGKRALGVENENNMQPEVNPELVQQLQMQIAMLQDQLARATKNTAQ